MSDLSLLSQPAHIVAPLLLGWEIERTIDNRKIRVKIVETEAYDQTDIASHSYNGQTERTKVMFQESGHLYVYFTYGMHYCCNIVTGSVGEGSAVLLRSVEPLNEYSFLESTRNKKGIEVTNGPAKLCQALKIDRTYNGHNLTQAPLKLIPKTQLPSESIQRTTRIGISKGKETKWRFYIKQNKYVSRQ